VGRLFGFGLHPLAEISGLQSGQARCPRPCKPPPYRHGQAPVITGQTIYQIRDRRWFFFLSNRSVRPSSQLSGIEGRLVYNINPAFSFDSAVSLYPADFKGFNQVNVQQGGRAFLSEFGLKGGIQRRTVGIFGFVRSGIGSFRFSRVGELNSLATQRRTSFLTDLGGTLEAYPSKRVITFLEVGAPLVMFAQRTKALGTGASLFAPGGVQSSLRIGTGVRFRLGQLSPEALAPTFRSRRYEVGMLFSTLSLQRLLGTLKHEPGIGIRGSYNLTDHLSFDSEINYFRRNSHAAARQWQGSLLGMWRQIHPWR
jgi:hypothetical protein